MIITSYIDLGNEGVVTPEDIEYATCANSGSVMNLWSYIGRKCAIRNHLGKITLSLDKDEDNQVVVNIKSSVSIASKAAGIESAIIEWFSPRRKGLTNVRLRFMLQDTETKVYINSMKIILE